MRDITKGSTDQSTMIRIVNSTTGVPEEAVEHNSSGISLWYRREGGSVTAITPAALAAANSAHSDGGIEHLDDGYYRLDAPDAAWASGANGVSFGGTVTGMVVIGSYHALVDFNPYDGVRLGLTALPNAAAEAPGGLYTRGSGAGQIAQDANGRINVNATAVEGSDPTDQIRDAAAAALVVHRLDELLNADSDIDGAAPPTVGSVFHELMTKTTGSFTYDQTTDSLEAIRDTGDADWATPIVPTAANIADAVWDEGYGDHQTNSTFGKIVTQTWSSIYAGGGAVDSTGATASSFRTDIVAGDGFYDDMLLTFTSGALAGQTRPIGSFVSTNGVFNFDEPFADAPANGVTFALLRTHVHPISQIQDGLATSAALSTIEGKIDTIDANVDDILVDTSTTLQGEIDGIQADTEDIQSRLPAALVSGRMDAFVGAMANNVMTAAAAAADLTTELQNGLATAAALTTVEGKIDTIDGNVDSILVDTAEIGAAGAGLTAVPWNASWDAEVQSEVQDALEANNLDHLVKSAVDTDFATTVHLDSVIGQLADNGTTATFDRTTDSQEAIRNRGDSAWTTATGFSTLDAAGVRTAVGLASANLDTQLDAIPTAAENRAEIDSNSTQLAAIVADTNELQADWANGGRLDLILDARASQTSVNTAQADLDILTGSDGVTLATSQPNYAPATASALTTVGNNVAAILADTGTDGVVISQSTREAIADTVLSRGVDNVEDSADPLSLTEIALCIFESARSGTTWTIRKSDGTTFSTRTLTVDADADPITGVT